MNSKYVDHHGLTNYFAYCTKVSPLSTQPIILLHIEIFSNATDKVKSKCKYVQVKHGKRMKFKNFDRLYQFTLHLLILLKHVISFVLQALNCLDLNKIKGATKKRWQRCPKGCFHVHKVHNLRYHKNIHKVLTFMIQYFVYLLVGTWNAYASSRLKRATLVEMGNRKKKWSKLWSIA